MCGLLNSFLFSITEKIMSREINIVYLGDTVMVQLSAECFKTLKYGIAGLNIKANLVF